jgi:hypothetical protein
VTFQPGVYRFHVRADDGVRAYVDGQRVLDEWHSASGIDYTFGRSMNGPSRLTVEYYERGGDARIRFWWERIG